MYLGLYPSTELGMLVRGQNACSGLARVMLLVGGMEWDKRRRVRAERGASPRSAGSLWGVSNLIDSLLDLVHILDILARSLDESNSPKKKDPDY